MVRGPQFEKRWIIILLYALSRGLNSRDVKLLLNLYAKVFQVVSFQDFFQPKFRLHFSSSPYFFGFDHPTNIYRPIYV